VCVIHYIYQVTIEDPQQLNGFAETSNAFKVCVWVCVWVWVWVYVCVCVCVCV